MIISIPTASHSAPCASQFCFALQVGLEQKAKEFVEKGSEVYVNE
jgi:hypothetical protein